MVKSTLKATEYDIYQHIAGWYNLACSLAGMEMRIYANAAETRVELFSIYTHRQMSLSRW
jgi:hypothetical protein